MLESALQDQAKQLQSTFQDHAKKLESTFQDRFTKLESTFQDRLTKQESTFQDRFARFTNLESTFQDRVARRKLEDRVNKLEGRVTELESTLAKLESTFQDRDTKPESTLEDRVIEMERYLKESLIPTFQEDVEQMKRVIALVKKSDDTGVLLGRLCGQQMGELHELKAVVADLDETIADFLRKVPPALRTYIHMELITGGFLQQPATTDTAVVAAAQSRFESTSESKRRRTD